MLGGLTLIRRYRWLLFLTTAAAFAAGWVLSVAALHPAPAAPDGELAAQAAEEQGCDDFAGAFVGLHDDRVAIFEGTPGGCHRLVETRSISARELPPFQVSDLKRGIAFSGEDELFQILEGLTAP